MLKKVFIYKSFVVKFLQGYEHRGNSGASGSAAEKGGKGENRKYWIAPYEDMMEHMNAWKFTSDGYAVCSWCWKRCYIKGMSWRKSSYCSGCQNSECGAYRMDALLAKGKGKGLFQ